MYRRKEIFPTSNPFPGISQCAAFFRKTECAIVLRMSKIYRTDKCQPAERVLRRRRKTPVFFVYSREK
jgi:hypothetical protein